MRESLGDGPMVSDYDFDTMRQVLAITHEDDDEVEEITLTSLVEKHPERFAQFYDETAATADATGATASTISLVNSVLSCMYL